MRYGRPGRMDDFVWQLSQFRDPLTHIGSVRIELLALGNRIEDAEVGRGVSPTAGHPLPVGGILGDIGVDQAVPEPGLSASPVDQQILDQEAGDNHPHPVVHEAGRPEFTHAGVNDGKAGEALAPGLEGLFVLAPDEAVPLRPEILGRQVGPVEKQVMVEFSPADFGQELLDLGMRGAVVGGILCGAPDLPGADLAEMHMGGEARGPGAVRPITVFRIGADRAAQKIV